MARNVHVTAVSINLDLLPDIDKRAHSLGLSRSDYLCRCAEIEMASEKPFELVPRKIRPGRASARTSASRIARSRKATEVGAAPSAATNQSAA